MTSPRAAIAPAMVAVLFVFNVAPAFAAPPALTPEGYGALKIGMSEAAARPLLGVGQAEGGVSASCREIASARDAGVVALFENGRLSRLRVQPPAVITTDKGIGLGARERDVYRAYPHLRSDGGFVDDGAPWQDLYDQPQGQSGLGLRFAIDAKGKVAEVDAGGPAIADRTGCP